MKHSNTIKILAALTAAPRWAIALMPADGAMFPWSGEPWFEIASGLLSLAFAAVEIWATAFVMQAWHEAQANGDERLARNLRRLWVGTLIILAVTIVPPAYANVMRVNVNTFSPLVIIPWLACVAASTFVVIGGVGYADRKHAANVKPDTAQTWQPVTLTPQAAPVTTASDDKPHDDKPLAPLTDHFVKAVWSAKKSNAPFADVEVDARACLNGTSDALAAWLATGKQSLNELAALLGVADESRKVFDATCRGLRKPTGTTIERG